MTNQEFASWQAFYQLEKEELDAELAQQRAELEAAKTGQQ